MTDHLRGQVNPRGISRLTFHAEITYKGQVVAKLKGCDRDQLKARAHRFATNLNYHRAAVQVAPAQIQSQDEPK